MFVPMDTLQPLPEDNYSDNYSDSNFAGFYEDDTEQYQSIEYFTGSQEINVEDKEKVATSNDFISGDASKLPKVDPNAQVTFTTKDYAEHMDNLYGMLVQLEVMYNELNNEINSSSEYLRANFEASVKTKKRKERKPIEENQLKTGTTSITLKDEDGNPTKTIDYRVQKCTVVNQMNYHVLIMNPTHLH